MYGLNLASCVDYSGAVEFIDAYKTARGCQMIPVAEVKDTQRFKEVIFTDLPLEANGDYLILHKGELKLGIAGGSPAKLGTLIPAPTPNDYNVVPVSVAAKAGQTAQLHLTYDHDVSNQDIKILRPGYSLKSLDNSVFTNEFLGLITDSGSTSLRSLGWLKINSSPVVEYSHFTEPDDRYWRGDDKPDDEPDRGTPYELFLQLCLETNQDPWVCTPHLANDHCVETMARIAFEVVPRNKWIYLEYTNEHWNTDKRFQQAAYCKEQGARLGISGSRFYARRLREIFAIWERVFGVESFRLRPVACGQTANSGVLEEVLKEPIDHLYGLAVAGYFGSNALVIGDVELASKLWSAEQCQKFLRQCKRINKAACVYEGGFSGGDSSSDGVLMSKRLLHSDPAVQPHVEFGLESFSTECDKLQVQQGVFQYFLATTLYKDNLYGLTPTSYRRQTPKYQAFANVAKDFPASPPTEVMFLQAQLFEKEKKISEYQSFIDSLWTMIQPMKGSS